MTHPARRGLLPAAHMLRQGEGPPLLLLHGVLCSERVWQRVLPLVAPHHDTIALTAVGHCGGPRAEQRPTRVAHLVDDVERTLDRLGIQTAHFAGNSLGGWIALELARRGSARSVCALSPAGCWPAGDRGPNRAADALRATMRDARRGRPFVPLLARSATFRRWAMKLNARHGHRLTASELVGAVDDLLGCEAGQDLLRTDEALAPFSSLPCPITLAWSEHDRVLPMSTHGARAREILPGARFVVLGDVGHVPMFDAPELVARTVLDCTSS